MNKPLACGQETGKDIVTPSLLLENFPYLSTKDVADFLRTTPGNVRQWVHHGTLKPSKRIGRKLLFERAAVLALLKDVEVDDAD